MSFLRKMFSGKVGADDPRRFLVEAMLGAMEADGDVTESEMVTFEGTLGGHSLFEGLSGEEIGRLTDIAADAIREAGGGKGRFAAMAKGLPSRHQRLCAYAMACEVCVADRELAESEIDFLDGLQTALALDETEAKEVFEAARRHSGLMTLEEKSEKVRALMPAFVRCMALMAAADEEVHHEERLGMRSVLRAIPDMQVLTGAEIDEAVDVALARVAGKDTKAELGEIAKDVELNADRYWITVYTMIIALADGKTDWREDAFLAQLHKTFGLSDKQMDLAMQTASQFPAVALGGDAPA
ncbi:MAG: TerB family tellurite resistance protein [Deltaproteobacteria bacterium]|nr:TerB family tellurite resistance protein [Deltaproteobacteria bacterium]